MEDDNFELFENPIQDYTVITLGEDWMVQACVKENPNQDNYQGLWIRLGDIPQMLTRVYSLWLCQAEGGMGSVRIHSCEEVKPEAGAYLLEGVSACVAAPHPEAATMGEWLKKAWNPAWRSLWLGEDVRLRAPGADVFHRAQRILAPRSMEYRKSRLSTYLSAGFRRWVKSEAGDEPVVQVEAPRMIRLVLSGVRWKESEPPCAISIALTSCRYNGGGRNHALFSLEVRGQRISETKVMLYPETVRYSSIADSYCEDGEPVFE